MDIKNNMRSGNMTIILAEIILLIVLAIHGCDAWRDNRTQRYDIGAEHIVEQGTDYEGDVDHVSISTKGKAQIRYLTITGWCIQKNVEMSSEANITVILQNITTGEYYKVPTTMKLRTDITRRYYDGNNYDYSGFTTQIRCNKKIALDESDYGIYLLVRNDSAVTIVNTGTTVYRWITEHSDS